MNYSLTLITLFFVSIPSAFAGEAPAPSIFSNPLAITFIILMFLLLFVIGILANVLVGAADIKRNKRKQEKNSTGSTTLLSILLLVFPSLVWAQDVAGSTTAHSTKIIGGMQASTFYIMASILFLELIVILVLLLNIKMLLKKEQQHFVSSKETSTELEKANQLSWWDRINKLRPVTEEAELDLGHEYDGIRELNNKLPPWWLYGFYATILFAVIYLWHFHVSHNGPSSKQEYERSVAKAELEVQEYLKKKGDAVDENTVTMLANAEDLQAGKAIFTDPSKCPACHNADGGGNAVGPNLTDDYWLYGGSIKDIFKTIKYGTSKGMRSWKDDLSAKQIAQVSSYIKTLNGTKPANPKEPQGELYKEAPVLPTADSIAKPDAKKVAMQ